MIAIKPFSVKIGGISYQVPAGKQIPDAVLDHWQAVKSKIIAEHEQQPEVKKAKYKKPEVPTYGEPELPIDTEQEAEKE
jgi:basic membrane lipoprotein Med (substrate-binding protein (PBP1-ABC) superfamily)